MAIESLKALLQKLESFWVKENAPILKKLNSGLKMPDIEIANFSGELPEVVWELYGWKNGVNPSPKDLIGQLAIFESGIFVSFEKAMETQCQWAGNEFGWDRAKFVLFESGGGEHFLIEGDSSSDKYGKIFYHSIKDTEFDRIISIYDSLYTLFLTVYECFTNGIYKYENNYLEIVGHENSFEIAKRINPRSEYWKLITSIQS